MASVDAGQYSLSSDEKVEFECSPCKDDGLVRQAEYFCPECSEYFCSSCESSSHRRLKATKSHKLLPASEATKTLARKTAKLPIMACVCNRDMSVEFICEEHKCLICSDCKVINHRKCETDAIVEKSKSLNEEVVNSLLQQAKSLDDKANHLCVDHSKHLETFKASKSQCRNEIIRIRDQLIHFVEKLANDLLDKLDAISVDNTETPSTDISACESIIGKLKQEQKLLQDVMVSGETQHIFVADFLLSNTFKNCRCLLDEIEKEMQITSIVLKVDTNFVEIQNKFEKMGDVMVKHRLKKKNIPSSLLPLKAVKEGQFDITPSGVDRMTGSAFIQNGDLAVCDYNARTVIILDPEFKEKTRLPVPGNVWGVTVLNENDIIVSLTSLKKLQFIEVIPALKLKNSINVGRECFDVKAIDSDIYVVCTNDPGDGEIRVLDLEGNVKRRLGLKTDGTYMLLQPIHMSVNNTENQIYVSDLTSKSANVVCMAIDGHVSFKLNNEEIKYPRGILLDSDGNFLLCCYRSIFLVKADGTICTEFVTKTDGLSEEAYTLNYRESDESLVVTMQYKLFVFKLAKA